MQTLLTFRGRSFGDLSLSIVDLKSWSPDVGFKTFTLHEEVWSCEFSQDYGLPQWGGDLCQNCVRAFHTSFECVGPAQLVFFRVVLCANCRFTVSMRGGDFKILPHYHFETELCFLF